MTLSTLLAQKRRELGFTYVDLEIRTDYSANTFANWENGKTIPKGNKLVAICEFFKIDPSKYPFIEELDELRNKPKTFGEQIKRGRIKKRLSIKEAAELLGFSESQLWKWENNKVIPREFCKGVLSEFYQL